jgi:hypothetical protein
MRILELLFDANGRSISVIPLSDPQDVDGTAESTVCENPIDGQMVRIKSLDNTLRIAVGPSSEETPLVVADDGIAISEKEGLFLPCNPGDYVAVKGGQANISTCGK